MAKVLVIGSGAREHAIAAQMLKSPQVDEVYCAPGNPGMKKSGIDIEDIDELDFAGLTAFAKKNQVDLTFVGPEVPLAKGIVDYFEDQGLKIFGPNQSSARLESNKEFAKKFMKRHDIPTAKYQAFTNVDEALDYAKKLNFPIVVKENGLAGGKGVTIVKDEKDLKPTIQTSLKKAGEILLEEFLQGEEYSVMVFVGGQQRVIFPISQDHKKLYEGEVGPNTGGMGAYSPVPHITPTIVKDTVDQIVDPTIKGLKTDDLEFYGIIYVGCMLTSDGPKVIEYNLRLGDPETQVLLPQMESNFYQVTMDLVNRKQPDIKFQEKDFYFGVVVAAPGYPKNPKQHIALPDLPENVYIAGVTEENGKLYSKGGRIFTLFDHASTLKEAKTKVYAELAKLGLSEFYYRKDIGFKDINN